jgi:hypothetical protein
LDAERDCPLFSVLKGIAEQVVEHLLHPEVVAIKAAEQVAAYVQLECDWLAFDADDVEGDDVAQQLRHFVLRRRQLQLPRLDFRDVKDVIDEP